MDAASEQNQQLKEFLEKNDNLLSDAEFLSQKSQLVQFFTLLVEIDQRTKKGIQHERSKEI
jgi:hypothetical protein